MANFLVVYFDDILIYSHDKEQHLGYLGKVCELLRNEKFYVNLKKCSFMSLLVVFLGFIVLVDGMSTVHKKV